jgi:hypothetical protein
MVDDVNANEPPTPDINLDDDGWETLITSIAAGRCTPFVGAGACIPALPSGSQLAQEWAAEYRYPLDDSSDLARVAQFLTVTRRSALYPKMKICDRLKAMPPPDFEAFDEPHAVLAELPLPVYLTTNYDDFMVKALQAAGKSPANDICRWNSRLRYQNSVFSSGGAFKPSAGSPVVFHLHGSWLYPESIVLTEDDYVDFLIRTSQDDEMSAPASRLLPPRILEAFAGSSLLFMGYRLSDWDFRLLYRSLVTYIEKSLVEAHVSVQLAPFKSTLSPERRTAALKYLDSYFRDFGIAVYWGTCRGFARELRTRWRKHVGGAREVV